jgi:hypothetical protein
LLRPVGSLCPKHDVELIDVDSPDLEHPPILQQSHLVRLRAFPTANEATAARIRLEAEGIPTFLDTERMGSQSFYDVATGGVKLLVPAELEADARILLHQIWTLPKADLHDDEDEWEELGPVPGSRRREVMRVAILVMLFGPTALFLFRWLVENMAR